VQMIGVSRSPRERPNRSTGVASALIPAVRRAVADVDPVVPMRSAMWMTDVVRSAYSISWVIMGLLVVLAAPATALGAIGIYAVLGRTTS